MRSAGILLPITALPSPYGVGTMGQSARDFIDFLHDSSQTYWQVLPIGPTSFGDSPYQSFSTFAGNPYLIDLDTLIAEGLLTQNDVDSVKWGADPQKVDYGLLYKTRFNVLRKAVKKLWDDHTFEVSQFCKLEHSWLDDYALYMSLKDANDSKPWTSWPEPVRLREPQALEQARKTLSADIKFWQGVPVSYTHLILNFGRAFSISFISSGVNFTRMLMTTVFRLSVICQSMLQQTVLTPGLIQSNFNSMSLDCLQK